MYAVAYVETSHEQGVTWPAILGFGLVSPNDYTHVASLGAFGPGRRLVWGWRPSLTADS